MTNKYLEKIAAKMPSDFADSVHEGKKPSIGNMWAHDATRRHRTVRMMEVSHLKGQQARGKLGIGLVAGAAVADAAVALKKTKKKDD